MVSLRSFNPCFGFPRRSGAIAASGFLAVLAFVFMVLCFSQLSAGSTLPNDVQATFAIASILQVVLVALTSTIIFASWKENARLIRYSAYSTIVHFVLNLTVLARLLVAVAPDVPCATGQSHCPKLVVLTPVWDVLSALILAAQLYLFLVVLSYSLYLQDYSRRPWMPEASRNLSAPPSQGADHKRLLPNSESWPDVELGAVESATTIRSFQIPESETGYGGGVRTYVEAEQNEKARLRREMEDEENQAVQFPVPSRSETGAPTPLGMQWRDGDLPPYAS